MLFLVDKYNPNFIELGGFSVKWYAVCILLGVLCTYLTVCHLFKKHGYKKEIVDSAILVVLPAGIIGARAWWVASEWESLGAWYKAFYIWEGGLAIQGGVVLGVLVGVWYFRKYHKNVPTLLAADLIIPNILIAQVLGRWGNFMNREVYGACVDPNTLPFIPEFIKYQMMGEGNINASSGIACPVDQMAQPLFLYESLCNLIGWALLVFVLPKVWKKGRKNGDQACLYFVWYGIVRVIMEPFRHPAFIMDMGGLPTSVVTSILFIIGGVLGMVILRLIPYLLNKRKAVKE